MDDSRIIELFFLRNEDALKETEKKYGNFIHITAFNITGTSEDAQECANDTYLKLWNSIPPEKPVYFKAYVGKLVRNTALSLYRKNKASKRDSSLSVLLSELGDCIPSAVTVEEDFDGKNLSQLISEWLYTLSEENRVLFIRRYWYGDSLKALSEKTGKPADKLASLFFSLRKQLKKELEGKGVNV